MYEIIIMAILAAIITTQQILNFKMKSKYEKSIKNHASTAVASFMTTIETAAVIDDAINYFNEKYDVQLSFDLDKESKRMKFTITDPEDGEKSFLSRPHKKSEENAERKESTQN